MHIHLRVASALPIVFVSSLLIAACDASTDNAPADASTGDSAQNHDSALVDSALADTAAADTSTGDGATTCPTYATIDADGGPVSQEEDAGTLPGPLATQCSATTTTASTINWVNDACETIEAWWIDFGCQEVYYNDIPAMAGGVAGMAGESTFVGHRWRLRAKGSHALLKEVDGNVDGNPRTVTFP